MTVNQAIYLNTSGVKVVGGVAVTPTTLTSSGGNVAVNAANNPRYELELTEATTQLNNPTNLVDGQDFEILIKQDATGSRALTFGTSWLLTDGITTAVNSTASAVTILRGHAADLPNGPGLSIYFTLEHAGESGGAGDVTGPVSSTDNAIALWNGTGGDTVKNSTITVSGQTIAAPSQAGNGLAITVTTGATTSTGDGGALTLSTAAGVGLGKKGGAVTIQPGSSPSSTGGANLTLQGASTTGGAAAGSVSVLGGTGSSTGGPVEIRAGGGTTGGADVTVVGGTGVGGGDLILKGGYGSSVAGVIILDRVETSLVPTKLRFVCDDATTITLTPPATAGNLTYTLPTVDPVSGYVLSSTAGGVMSWVSAATNEVDATVQTTDATVTTIATVATSTDNAVYMIDVSFFGIDPTAGDVYERGMRAVVYRNGASALSVANVNNYSTYGDDVTWAATIDVSGTNILLRVQGDATNATEWRVVGSAKEHA